MSVGAEKLPLTDREATAFISEADCECPLYQRNPCVKVTCGFFMKGLLFPVWYVKIRKKIGKIQA